MRRHETDGWFGIVARFVDDALKNGTIVAKDYSRLVFFSRNGEYVRTAGRRGRGPGEFLQTRELCRLNGDSLMVIDQVAKRITLWDSSGSHLATFAPPGDLPNGSCHPKGMLVVRDPGTPGTTADTIDRLVQYRLVEPDGRTVSNLGMHPGFAVGLHVPQTIVVPTNEKVYIGNSRSYDIRTFDMRGTLKRILRLGRRGDVITDEEWRTRVQQTVPRGVSRSEAEAITRPFAQKPHRYPAFQDIRIDPVNRLWVADYGTDQNWTVFDSSGVVLGRVHLNPDPESRSGLAGMGRDYIVIRSRDDVGALHLLFYRISPTSSSAGS